MKPHGPKGRGARHIQPIFKFSNGLYVQVYMLTHMWPNTQIKILATLGYAASNGAVQTYAFVK